MQLVSLRILSLLFDFQRLHVKIVHYSTGVDRKISRGCQ